MVARYEFDNRARNSGESVSHYVATLKHLATECKFGEAVRTERLRDRLVSGIRNPKMITDLLKVKLADLTFELAVQKCLAIVQAIKMFKCFKENKGQILQSINLTLPNLGRDRFHPSCHKRERVPGVRTPSHLNLATVVRGHTTRKSAPSLRNAAFTVA